MENLLDPDPHNGSSLFFLMFDTQSTGNRAMIDKWNPFKPKNCFLAKKIINKVKEKKNLTEWEKTLVAIFLKNN